MRVMSLRPRGTILLVVLITVMVIAGVSASVLTMVRSEAGAVQSSWAEYQAFELAESAMAQARSTLAAQTGANGDALAAAMRTSGPSASAVTWDTNTNRWVAAGSIPTWSATSDDTGVDGTTSGAADWGEGDGFPNAPDINKGLPGEPNFFAYRLANNTTDEHLWAVAATWWGGDGIDNDGDGDVDAADDDETRTYTVRANGIYQNNVVELETVLTRDPPPPAVDPNNPPAGFLAAISLQVGGSLGSSPTIHNASAVNTADGTDTQTNISGAGGTSSSDDTNGVMLSAPNSPGSTLNAKNDSAVNGIGGNPSFNNNGAFIGDIVDTIADGVKTVATDTSGNPSDNANNQSLGTASTSGLKLVYHDYDKHGKFTPTTSGFGILVVDVTTLQTDSSGNTIPPLQFSGNNTDWDGIVIVRVKGNTTINNTNGFVQATGSGSSSGGQRGSVVIYNKGNLSFSGNGGFYKNNGNRPTYFSMGAVQAALTAFNTQVPPTNVGTVGTPLMWRPVRQPGMAWGN